MKTLLSGLILIGFIATSSSALAQSFLAPVPWKIFKLSKEDSNVTHVQYEADAKEAYRRGFKPLINTWGEPNEFRPNAFLFRSDKMKTDNTRRYGLALVKQKSNLMRIYKLRNQTYNKLAVMAFGIYGVESKFGTNWKYQLKEYNQGWVTWLKGGKGENSRGGTQIKVIPDEILENYPKINPETLKYPEYSAIATIGFMANILKIIRGLRDQQIRNGVEPGEVNLSYITDENIFDYVPYVYSGQMRKLFNNPQSKSGASVHDNLYVLEMKSHMRWFQIWEMP